MLGATLMLLLAGLPAQAPVAARDLVALREAVALAVEAVGAVKLELTMFHTIEGRWPVDANEAGLTAAHLARPAQGVQSIRVEAGAIVLTLGGTIDTRLQGRTIGFAPCVRGVEISWACGYASCNARQPLAAGVEPAVANTSVPGELLSAMCR